MSATGSEHSRVAPDSDEIDLSQLLDTLNYYKYKILLTAFIGLILGLIYVFSVVPTYQANAMVQLESKNASSNILSDLKNLNAAIGGESPESDAEVQLIKSRLVLGRTIDDLDLTTHTNARYAPFIGRFWHYLTKAADPKIQITQFIVPNKFIEDAYTQGKFRFSLSYLGNGKYELTAPDGKNYTGKIGAMLTTPDGIVLQIAQIQADAGQNFTLYKQNRLQTIDELQKNLSAADKGKKTGILGLTLNSTNPQSAQVVLNTIVQNYVNQNRERGIQIAGASLNFIDEQLPKTRAALNQAEDELNAYRNKNATIDISTEAKDVLQSLSQVEMQLTELKTKEAEVVQLFTPNHPNYQALQEKRTVLEKAQKDLTRRISNMPQTQQDVIRLNRAVEIQQTVYLQLLAKQQELSITRASALGNVRVVDSAVTLEKPIKPQKPIIIALCTLGAAFLCALYGIAKTLLRHGIHDAEDIEVLGLPVFASVPFSETQSLRDTFFRRSARFNKNVRSEFLLAHDDPADIAVESIRALRTSLYFTLMEAGNNILLVSGATPAVGKTFVSANLATVIAQSGKKILLIDSDMRKGYMHEMLHQELGAGFAEVLAGTTSVEKVITPTIVPGLDFMSRGEIPSQPAELLLGSRLQPLLDWASRHYDFVILDAPPVLAVTDAAILGQRAGTVLVVARFGESTQKDVEMSIQRFANSNIKVSGAIINGIKQTANNYAAYQAYSRYAQTDSK